MTDKGAIKLGESLRDHPNVSSVLICGREITDEGAITIAENIKMKPKMRKIAIWGSEITETGVSQFFNILKLNKMLLVIHIGSEKLSTKYCEDMVKAGLEIHKGCSISVMNGYEEFNGEFIKKESYLSDYQ